jgi:hypothetical protein
MQNITRNTWIAIAAVLAVVILIGALVLFQGGSTFDIPGGTASTTGATASTTATTTDGQGALAITTTVGGAGKFGIVVDTSHAVVRGTLPPVTVNLPDGSKGKTLEFALLGDGDKPGVPQHVLISVPVNVDGDAFHLSGLRLSTTTDATSGVKTAVTPGTYKLEVVLWDKNPFVNGIYGDLSRNNATAIFTAPFTIAAQ